MCLDMFEREIKERRKIIYLGNCPKSFFFFFLQNEGPGSFYIGKLTLQLLAHLVWPPATRAAGHPC